MGRLYQRSKAGPYWGDYTDPNGTRHQLSLRTRDRAVARERLRAAELAATPQARGRKQRLSDAIDYVIQNMSDKAEGTRDMYRVKGRRLHATFGDPNVGDITRDMVQAYIAKRLSDDPTHGGAAKHTVQKELIVMRRAMREAHERGILPVMPALPRFSPGYEPRETWLTVDQFERLVGVLDPARALWASLAALGGMRAGEVERLRWRHVHLPSNTIQVPGTKTEAARRPVPIAPALRARLDAARGVGPDELVVGAWGNVRRDLAAAVTRANTRAALAAADAGVVAPPKLPRVSPNDLRRTFASWMVQQGVQLHTVAILMGHSSSRMVEKVYGKLSRDQLDAAILSLPAWGTVTPVSLSGARSTLLPPTPVQVGPEPVEVPVSVEKPSKNRGAQRRN